MYLEIAYLVRKHKNKKNKNSSCATHSNMITYVCVLYTVMYTGG